MANIKHYFLVFRRTLREAMNPPHAIRGLNWIMLVFGLRLFNSSRWLKILNFVFMLGFVTKFYSTVLFEIRDMTKPSGKYNLLVQSIVGYYTSFMTIHVLLLWRKRKIQSFMIKICDHLRHEEKITVLRVSIGMFIMFIMNSILHVLAYGCLWDYCGCETEFKNRYFFVSFAKEPVRRLLEVIYHWELVIDNSFSASLFLYFLMFYMRYRFILGKIRCCLTHVETRLTQLSFDALIERLGVIWIIQEEFEELFAFIPFLLLTTYFFAMAGHIYWFKPDARIFTVKYQVNVTILVCMETICLFIMIALIDKFQGRIKSETEKVVSLIRRRQKLSNLSLLFIKELRMITSAPVTAWTFCTLDKSLILSYLSSLLTFTVLFIQAIGYKKD